MVANIANFCEKIAFHLISKFVATVLGVRFWLCPSASQHIKLQFYYLDIEKYIGMFISFKFCYISSNVVHVSKYLLTMLSLGRLF